MKKHLSLICACFLLIFIFLPTTVSSADPEKDSFNTEDIRGKIPGDIVIRAYNSYIYADFAKFDSIDEILLSYEKNEYYIACSGGQYIAYNIWTDGRAYELQGSANYTILIETLLKGEVIKQIDPEIQVHNVYYIEGRLNFSGSAIYYKTDLGDYVYYYHNDTPFNGEYLMSAESFFAMLKAHWESMMNYDGPALVGGGGSFTDLDLSAYRIGSANFDPDAPFPVPKDNESHGTLWLIGGIALAVVLSAAATWFFLRRRKNALLSNEPESI